MTISSSALVSRTVKIRGVVQGVGFRPFVYKLAVKNRLRGFVRNSSSGVTIGIEGDERAIATFLEELRQNPPPLAQIDDFQVHESTRFDYLDFRIENSEPEVGEFVLVSPDIATCEDCLMESNDPNDRRYGYPFTNCTNCGPRYTIVCDIPYDRPTTTMAQFHMCSECNAEYHDPASRRFHAQPNACPVCGPTLALAKAHSFNPGAGSYGFGELSAVVLSDVRQLLHEGAIVGIKGLGGFQLACNAENEKTVQALRSRKKRSDKPFALMARDVESVEKFCKVTEDDRRLLLGRERPIVILQRLDEPRAQIPSAVAPGNRTIGVMLPYTPLHYLLFSDSDDKNSEFTALVMTSGNISEEPIITSNETAWEGLGSVADWFLFHNRPIYMLVDDSVAKTVAGKNRILRRSRGYAPQAIDLGQKMTELLAVGADLKNAFCLTKGKYAILSQHIGDVENFETVEFFQETLSNLKKLFRVEPKAVAHDMHPQYLTSKLAADTHLPQFPVQHHHAHIASCMTENRLREPVIGVAFDGTGYGTDGQIWGGEFLIADLAKFERWGHFRYVGLPGGDQAIRQPWRSALSWLWETFGSALPADIPSLDKIPPRELAIVTAMLERKVNTVSTSSCGRLFDAVASLLDLRQEVTFEGQAAIELENAAEPDVSGDYSFDIEAGSPAQIDMRQTICEILRDIRKEDPKSLIASRFQNTIVAVIVEVCRRIQQAEHLNRVCLSGGTFQNVYLLERTVAQLCSSGFEVFLHSAVPPNDGGISLGQAVIANEALKAGA